MFSKIYFEQYDLGNVLEMLGRTITETNIMLHAGQTGNFFPHHMGGTPWANISGTLTITVRKALLDKKVTVVRIDFAQPIDLYQEKGKEILLN